MADFTTRNRLTLAGPLSEPDLVKRLFAILLVSSVVFGADILLELPGSIFAGEVHGVVQTLHVIVEFLALLLLIWGFVLARRHIRQLRQERDSNGLQLQSLRGEFDLILQDQFARWQLTEAERDIALLTLRGLKIADIAAARNTRQGTVKAHMSAVFRKAGVGTRGELNGLFMESFLDCGAAGKHAGPP